MSGEKLVYWDSGIFIAWLTDEARDPAEMQGIEEQIEAFEKGTLFICTSTLTLAEILPGQLPRKVREIFENLDRNRNFEFVQVTKKIARLAQELRDYYSRSKVGTSTTLAIPDSVYLATAIIQGCEVFYTFDAKERPGKSQALAPLSGTIAGKYYLKIEKPGPSSDYSPRMNP
jgi:predicted nucleic acid-binding protein